MQKQGEKKISDNIIYLQITMQQKCYINIHFIIYIY